MSQIPNPIICPRCYAYKDGNTMPICICEPISVDPQEELRTLFYKEFPAFKNRAYTEETAKIIADWWLSKLAEREQAVREQAEAQAEYNADEKFEKALGVMVKRLGGEVTITDSEMLEDIIVFQSSRDEKTNGWKFKAVKNVSF